ncbi:hypothetical protein SALWKB12_0449 [Snodgrassella communis]|nr:hypothetical protein SALWKB12_0449 [Snodgrassella communis]
MPSFSFVILPIIVPVAALLMVSSPFPEFFNTEPAVVALPEF